MMTSELVFNEPSDFWDDCKLGIFKIADRLYQGPAPRVSWNHFNCRGITHILNLSECPNCDVPDDLAERFMPIADLHIFPTAFVLDAMKYMREILLDPSQALFIHCAAGQNRSPSLLWLFLLYCGIRPNDAKTCIEENTLDAVAGHPLLVNEKLVDEVMAMAESMAPDLTLTLHGYAK